MMARQDVDSRGKNGGGRPLAVLAVVLLSLALNLWNNGFPLGYHADEPKKVRFVLTGAQDFHHPLLMLDLVRAANLPLRLDRPQTVVRLGRTLTGIQGALIVLVFFLIARRLLASPYDLLAALALAVSPILVVHSHYLKEDIPLTLFCLLTLLALFSFVEKPRAPRALLFGVALGCAVSSHYKGLLLLPILAAAPLLSRANNRASLYARLGIAALIAFAVFLAINYPLLSGLSDSGFARAAQLDSRQFTGGHVLRVYPLAHLFSFHLVHSIVPGITLVAALIAGAFILCFLVRWRLLDWREKLLLIYLGVFTLAVEITPSKPHPDFMRYVIPQVPVLFYFIFRGVELLARPAKAIRRAAAWALALLAIAVPLQASVRLDYHLTRDTRAEARRILATMPGAARFERYASAEARGNLAALDADALRDENVRYLVASSFEYGRYYYGARLAGQRDLVYTRHRRYEEIFRLPYREIRPAYRSFAFSNPTIRIVDIGRPQGGE